MGKTIKFIIIEDNPDTYTLDCIFLNQAVKIRNGRNSESDQITLNISPMLCNHGEVGNFIKSTDDFGISDEYTTWVALVDKNISGGQLGTPVAEMLKSRGIITVTYSDEYIGSLISEKETDLHLTAGHGFIGKNALKTDLSHLIELVATGSCVEVKEELELERNQLIQEHNNSEFKVQ